MRVIAATNRNLRREVAAGRFREDLFYRLQVYPIMVPPLPERREDIPLLVEHFTTRIAARYAKPIREVPGQVMRLLAEWDWPGNVRELENVIERAVISSPGPTLTLPRDFGQAASVQAPGPTGPLVSLEEMERGYIRRVLEFTAGKIAGAGGAADVLGCLPHRCLIDVTSMPAFKCYVHMNR